MALGDDDVTISMPMYSLRNFMPYSSAAKPFTVSILRIIIFFAFEFFLDMSIRSKILKSYRRTTFMSLYFLSKMSSKLFVQGMTGFLFSSFMMFFTQILILKLEI